MSLDERHTENFLTGVKSVELRRRTVNIAANTYVWFYTKLPRGCVEAYAIVESVKTGSPYTIWRAHKNALALSKKEFDQYLNGSNTATIIQFSAIEAIDNPIYLSEIRAQQQKFQPPQFFRRLMDSDPELALFKAAIWD